MGQKFIDYFVIDGSSFDTIVFKKGGRINNYNGNEDTRYFDRMKSMEQEIILYIHKVL